MSRLADVLNHPLLDDADDLKAKIAALVRKYGHVAGCWCHPETRQAPDAEYYLRLPPCSVPPSYITAAKDHEHPYRDPRCLRESREVKACPEFHRSHLYQLGCDNCTLPESAHKE